MTNHRLPKNNPFLKWIIHIRNPPKTFSVFIIPVESCWKKFTSLEPFPLVNWNSISHPKGFKNSLRKNLRASVPTIVWIKYPTHHDSIHTSIFHRVEKSGRNQGDSSHRKFLTSFTNSACDMTFCINSIFFRSADRRISKARCMREQITNGDSPLRWNGGICRVYGVESI